MVRIAWRSKITGYEGHGQRVLTYSDASLWIRRLNQEYPCLSHWIEK